MNSFFYFDGIKFQKCLTLNNSIGIPINYNSPNLAHFVFNNKVEPFLTENKIGNNCVFNSDNVNAQLYILSDTGFELVVTNEMNLRVSGLSTKDLVSIDVSSVLGIDSIEKVKFDYL